MKAQKVSYYGLLKSKEYLAFKGRNSINQVILILIITLSLGCIGLALQIYYSLQEKMSNPFTNWVDLPVSVGFQDSVKTMEDHVMRDEKTNQFYLNSIVEYNQRLQAIFEPNLQHKNYLFLRSMQYDEDLFRKFTDLSNIVYGKYDDSWTGEICKIIITEELFKSSEYVWDERNGLKIALPFRDSTILLDVLAVVKDIPNLADIVCSAEMMNLLSNPVDESKFYRTGNISEVTFLLQNKIEQFDDDILSGNSLESFEINPVLLYGERVFYLAKLNFRDYLDYPSKDSIMKYLILKSGGIVEDLIDWECVAGNRNFNRPQFLAFNFSKLDRIRDFKDHLLKNYAIPLDISEVDDKENFALVSKLAISAILSIILIGVMCLVIFMYFLIKSHIESVKQNIGTFMAFGLSQSLIIKAYLTVIIKLMLSSTFAAVFILLLFNLICQLLVGKYFILVFHILIFIVTFLFILVGFIIGNLLISKMCRNTPGNLIYNRV